MFTALDSAIRLAEDLNGTTRVESALSEGLDITIVGHNDFYSQRAKVCIILL